MITNLLLKLVAFIASLILGALPTVPVPSWLSGSTSAVGTVFQAAGSMGAWFPVALAVTVFTATSALWFTGFGIKVGRIVASFLTLGGGGAG